MWLKKEYFALKFLLPTIKITCHKCNKEYLLNSNADLKGFKDSSCFFHDIEVTMSHYFVSRVDSKTIVNEYFNKEDNFICMIISIFLLLFTFFVKYYFNLDNSMYIFSFFLSVYFLFTYIKFIFHINVEKAFEIILPNYNEKDEFLYLASIIAAQCNNISNEEYSFFIKNRFRDLKYLYKEMEYI